MERMMLDGCIPAAQAVSERGDLRIAWTACPRLCFLQVSMSCRYVWRIKEQASEWFGWG